MQRLAKGKIKGMLGKGEIEGVVAEMIGVVRMGKGSVAMMVDAVVELLNVYGDLGENSGIVEIAQYLCDNYLKQILKDKPSIQKALKIILSASKQCPTLLSQK